MSREKSIDAEPIELPEEAQQVGWFGAINNKAKAVTLVNVAFQVTVIVLIARGMAGVDEATVEDDVDHLLFLFLTGSIGALLIGVFLALGSQILVKKSMTGMQDLMRSVSDGELHPGITYSVHDYDAEGTFGHNLSRLLLELRGVAEHADRLAAGDLSATIEPRSDRDQLRHALAGMTDGLREMVGDLSAAADRVSAASERVAAEAAESGRSIEEISRAVEDVAHGAERQVRSVEDVRELSGSVTGATQESASSAQEAADQAGRAQRLATDGASAVVAATEAMDAVRGASEEVTVAIRALSERSTRIGSLVDTIGGIAEQTNLLALNAAIEAARAGEHGKGFAVVAEEVRNLAEESRKAAQSISDLVTEIRSETDRAVKVVADGATRTQDGVATVEAARTAFEAIGKAVEATSTRVAEIAGAVGGIAANSATMTEDIGEVAAVAEQSSAAAEQVAASTQQTQASTQQISASAQELAASAQELRSLAGRFTLA